MRPPCKGVRHAQTRRFHFDRGDDHRGDHRHPRGDRLALLRQLHHARQAGRSPLDARRPAREARAVFPRQPHLRRRLHGRHDRAKPNWKVLHVHLHHAQRNSVRRGSSWYLLAGHGRLYVPDRSSESAHDRERADWLERRQFQLLGHEEGRIMLVTTRTARGFTLVELMVGLTLLAFLLMLALPAFGTFIQNQKLRGKAESILTGLQVARTEAVRLNTDVEFLLTDSDPDISVVTTAAVNKAGPHWMVRGNVMDAATQISVKRLLQAQTGSEGTGQKDASSLKLDADTGAVTFGPYGTAKSGADRIRIRPASSAGTCVVDGGALRCLDVTVSSGGQIRMCDPAVTKVGDTRRC